MDQPDHLTFGDWLSHRLGRANMSSQEFASILGYADPDFIKEVCENNSRLPLKDWPTVSKALQLRMDEFLIVMEYYHPDWLMEYDAFISNSLRYLLWRMDNDSVQERGWLEGLLRMAVEEIIEPACITRFYGKVERRKGDRRKIGPPRAEDQRVRMRRLSDLVQYFKIQLGMIPGILLMVSGIDLMRGWGLL